MLLSKLGPKKKKKNMTARDDVRAATLQKCGVNIFSLFFSLRQSGTEKAHKCFQHKLFGPPTQNTPFWAPRKKFMCLISWERTQKRIHINFWGGIFRVEKGEPFGHKKFSLLVFSALAENCGCFRRLFGGSRGKLRESPRKKLLVPTFRARCVLKSTVPAFSSFLSQRCHEIWREILVKFSAHYVFWALGVRIGKVHQQNITPKMVHSRKFEKFSGDSAPKLQISVLVVVERALTKGNHWRVAGMTIKVLLGEVLWCLFPSPEFSTPLCCSLKVVRPPALFPLSTLFSTMIREAVLRAYTRQQLQAVAGKAC